MEYKIYTRKGDKGETSLIGGTRIPKYHIRIEAYGTIDELGAFVAVIHDSEGCDDHTKSVLIEIQNNLFTLESHLAQADDSKSKKTIAPLLIEDIQFIENEIDKISKTLPPLTNFVVPGGCLIASHCHVARTVCRRAERVATHLASQSFVDEIDLMYLNRLSDYFFVLSRHLTQLNKGKETFWIPRK